MNAYSIDNNSRNVVVVIILVTSMILSVYLPILLENPIKCITMYLEEGKFEYLIRIIDWLGIIPDLFGPLFLFGILSLLYEKLMWKIFRFLHGIPNLNGVWKGELISSYDNKSIEMEMTVKQTWSKISIQSNFPKTNSSSDSNIAAIYVHDGQKKHLYFGYKNDSYNLEKNNQTYYGYNILTLMKKDEIQGRYFNDRPNDNPEITGGNKGSFYLIRDKKLKRSKKRK